MSTSDLNSHAPAATATAQPDVGAASSVAAALPAQAGAVRSWLSRWLVPVVLPLLLLVAWDLAVTWSGTMLVPSPKEVALMLWDFAFGGIYDDAFSGSLAVHWWKSITRVYGAFALASLVAIPLGLVIGKNAAFRRFVDPTLQMLRPVPVTAWLPLSMIFFGVGPNAAIFLVFLGAFFPIVINTTFGVKSVDGRLFEAAAMLGCKGTSMFRQVVLPAAMPSIFNGLRLGHGISWFLIVVGEMTGVQQGLGAAIMDARMLSRTDVVIAGMVVIGVSGFVTDRFIVALNNRLLKWSPQHNV
ncbi:ABC transporter permease [Herbaspirillum sp. YR522]|uniref:ABC transporter permease n=1 Tax=Herbaspirillum sp. YR522 TaxID=1144342 RepID=UPI00026FBBF1|nr:ABC transporter permease [Herbaspirillum sp. YR522]EJN08690.1 ABC-type nitrate/sulfonate/bicarbonate transport system, permease component [Herbaspirillum sp. YR522]